MPELRKSRVIFVGDVVESTAYAVSADAYQADNPTVEEVEVLRHALQAEGWQAEVISSVSDFANGANYELRRDDLVFPLWRGGPSRNRTALVPGICEARGVRYVGSDAFVHALCQDKSLSKAVAARLGLAVAAERVIRSREQLDELVSLPLPDRSWIVKPLFGACSIGIDDAALTNGLDEAREATGRLFDAGLGPVLVEEFVPGREISWCAAGWAHTRHILTEFVRSDGSCPFEFKPYTFEDKLGPSADWSFSKVDPAGMPGIEMLCAKVMTELGAHDLFRIDIRLGADGPVLLELTPDIHLGLDSLYLGGFAECGLSPVEVLCCIVEGADRRTTGER